MGLQSIDAAMLRKMFLAGANNLERNKEYINELNVFPVPDGDTGTNMTMTITSAAKALNALPEDASIEDICKAIATGSLTGARGNSGVILSQLIRGFTKSVSKEQSLDIISLAAAFDKAVEAAYHAVMKPKEGTILTVAKGAAQKALELCENGEEDLETFIEAVIEHAKYVLSQTPEMLPVLKQAGVVDSGGQGLVEVMCGAYDAYMGKEIIPVNSDASKKAEVKEAVSEPEEIKFGYCTEFIILLDKTFNIKSELDFKEFLESIGDSIVCVADGDIVKIHVHTNDPGLAIQRALKYGQLTNLKIDNMRLEHQERVEKASNKAEEQKPSEPMKEVGFIAISAGDGLSEIFKSLGVDYTIEGGQTMNPSTADILNAVEKVNAKNVFVLPNNKNIILAANQAAELVSEKSLLVIPTKTIPQGITAIINYIPEAGTDENEQNMIDAISSVRSGQVTYAVRDTVIDDISIKKDDFMGIGDKGILSAGKDMFETTMQMIRKMMEESGDLISIYYGKDILAEDAEKLKNAVEKEFSSCDVELEYGGQPIYYYMISVE